MSRRHVRISFIPILLLLVLPVLGAKGPRHPEIEPGESLRGIIRADRDHTTYRTYVLNVPVSAVAIQLRLLEADADLDLYLRHGEEMSDYSEADFFSESEDWLEELTLYKTYENYLPSGRYYLDVAYTWDERPRKNGAAYSEIPFLLEYRVLDGQNAVDLPFGIPTESVLNDQGQYAVCYRLDVPQGTESFRIDVLDTDGDVDLFLNPGDPAALRGDIEYISDTYLGRESIVVQDLPRTGPWFLTVLEASETLYPVPVRLIATLGVQSPSQAPSPPQMAPSGGSAESMRTATVQLISPWGIGSGCIVSPSGKILTNHHVVVDNAGKILDSLVVAVSSGDYSAPEEAFSARIIDTSEEDDLALLEIVGDRWGRPLSDTCRFPYWELGDSESLAVGDSLWLMGYPWMGSGLSRSHFTLTRGILSGGEMTPYGLIYKTDGVISGGSSGGAVSDENGRLLGLPSFVVSDNAAQLTYFIPTDRLPRDWRRLIRYE